MQKDRHQSSFEDIREVVAREGKEARNLVAWSVPVATARPGAGGGRGRRLRKNGPCRGKAPVNAPHLVPPKDRVGAARKLREGSPAKKPDLHCRYWSYLFDNLHRAVDEIYCTCEEDESVIECEVRPQFPPSRRLCVTDGSSCRRWCCHWRDAGETLRL